MIEEESKRNISFDTPKSSYDRSSSQKSAMVAKQAI